MGLAPAITIGDLLNTPSWSSIKRITELELTTQGLVEDKAILERSDERAENALLGITVGDMVKDKKTDISSFAAAFIIN